MPTTVQHHDDRAVVCHHGPLTWAECHELVGAIETAVEAFFYSEIEIIVSSPGGATSALVHVLGALSRWRSDGVRFHTRVISNAASAAAILVCTGDERCADPGAGLLYPGADRFRTATRKAFDRLVETVVNEQIDFLVIAGDLYDGDWRDFNTGLFFVSRMARLNEAGVRVYFLHGNHDAESVITKHLELPPNVHVFSANEPSTFELAELGVALHGRSFPDRAVLENLVPAYPEPVPGAFNIGVLHTALEGMGGHARYAPCSLADLVGKGYNYWALGHVHQGQVLRVRPHVVFPGNLQGRHIPETGPKGAALVTVQDREVADIDHLAFDVVRWSRVQVPVEGARSLANVNDRLRAAIASAAHAVASGRLLICRAVLEGRSDLHAELTASTERLLADARASALALGDGVAWVEKLILETEPSVPAAPDAPMAGLDDLFAKAAADPLLAAAFDADIGLLARRLPHEIGAKSTDPALAAAVRADVASLIARLTSDLSARLVT